MRPKRFKGRQALARERSQHREHQQSTAAAREAEQIDQLASAVAVRAYALRRVASLLQADRLNDRRRELAKELERRRKLVPVAEAKRLEAERKKRPAEPEDPEFRVFWDALRAPDRLSAEDLRAQYLRLVINDLPAAQRALMEILNTELLPARRQVLIRQSERTIEQLRIVAEKWRVALENPSARDDARITPEEYPHLFANGRRI